MLITLKIAQYQHSREFKSYVEKCHFSDSLLFNKVGNLNNAF